MDIYREITPLKEPDVFVVLDSVSNGFDYPIHNHPEFELNLVAGISGTRIVGDSIERYTEYDLVLLGPYLYHKWDADAALLQAGQPYRVITIQFGLDLFNAQLFQKERFHKIRQLLHESVRGIRYHGPTFERAMQLMVSLTADKGFASVLAFLQLLELLSESTDYAFLASEGFNPQAIRSESTRMQYVYGYILKNFADYRIKIADVAAMVNLSTSAFSHFFQKYTNKSFTQFLLDVRLGHACKLLLSTDNPIKHICYAAGFNNLANFNRLFRKYRGCTPVEYRRRHQLHNAFDWTRQVTPWQFLPPESRGLDKVTPVAYATRLLHV